MKDLSDSSTKQLEERRKVLEAAQGRVDELQQALERAWGEIAEQKKLNSKVPALIMEAQQVAREEFNEMLLRQAKEGAEREANLSHTIQELRSALSRGQERAGWREDELEGELQQLKARLAAAESRNEELAQAVPEATRPLLRQIEHLQASNGQRSKLWEELECNLTQRLHEAEERYQRAVDREREMKEEVGQLHVKIRSMEGEVSLQKSLVARSQAQLELLKTQCEEKERELIPLRSQVSMLQSSLDRAQQELRTRQEEMSRLQAEVWEREESWKQRLVMVELERDREAQEKKKESTHMKHSASTDLLQSLTSMATQSGSLTPLEKLQGLLKQKEGELQLRESKCQEYERANAHLQDEIVKLTARNDSLYPVFVI
jgi:chromosome segregation ATPase